MVAPLFPKRRKVKGRAIPSLGMRFDPVFLAALGQLATEVGNSREVIVEELATSGRKEHQRYRGRLRDLMREHRARQATSGHQSTKT